MKSQWIGRIRRHTTRSLSGSLAEQQALEYLEAAGLTTVCRNFRCRLGEIDLIMRDGEYLVFVEVRYRSGSGFVSAAQSVDRRKQRKIARSARLFMSRQPALCDLPARFDVVAIERAAGVPLRIQWLRDAFRV